jgi:hypothetical protein
MNFELQVEAAGLDSHCSAASRYRRPEAPAANGELIPRLKRGLSRPASAPVLRPGANKALLALPVAVQRLMAQSMGTPFLNNLNPSSLKKQNARHPFPGWSRCSIRRLGFMQAVDKGLLLRLPAHG